MNRDTTSRELFAAAKRTVRLYIVGARKMGAHDSAVFYWRCRATQLLRRALAARAGEGAQL